MDEEYDALIPCKMKKWNQITKIKIIIHSAKHGGPHKSARGELEEKKITKKKLIKVATLKKSQKNNLRKK